MHIHLDPPNFKITWQMIQKNRYCQFGENLQKITEATGDDLNHSNSILHGE
jgi:hypothetical protein